MAISSRTRTLLCYRSQPALAAGAKRVPTVSIAEVAQDPGAPRTRVQDWRATAGRRGIVEPAFRGVNTIRRRRQDLRLTAFATGPYIPVAPRVRSRARHAAGSWGTLK